METLLGKSTVQVPGRAGARVLERQIYMLYDERLLASSDRGEVAKEASDSVPPLRP